ncbi:hypothetical protein M413DRAFT_265975 [Hebeloma cylindrosporum]|uniref:Uncharacterized protein n=1 Tax=Hebeloma cylindrosporum TaxID=76867 RepID=A0A0C2YAQ5_HEBCY|nr:hypothetical protein M413DRAFT_265975 [Hebeloma cylindrosporum h7]
MYIHGLILFSSVPSDKVPPDICLRGSWRLMVFPALETVSGRSNTHSLFAQLQCPTVPIYSEAPGI